jgi:hypothetical protein
MNTQSHYAPPKSDLLADHPGGWDGSYVRLKSPGAMPCHCITCGTDEGLGTHTAKLSYVNPWIYLTFFLSLIVLLIVYLVAIKRAVVTYSQCPDCAAVLARWSTISKVCAGVIVVALVACIAPIGDGAKPMLALVAFAGLVAYAITAALARPKMRISKVSDGVFFIGHVTAAYRRRVSEWAPNDLRALRQ